MPLSLLVSYVILWILVLLETVLLVLLLKALGEIRQKIKSGIVTETPAPNLEIGGLEIGEMAPSFTALDQSGKAVSLDNLKGQRLILAFVSVNCTTCQKTIDFLNRLQHREHGLRILAMGMDSDWTSNREFAERSHAQIPVLTTDTDIARDLYHVKMISAVFALDEEGVIRSKKLVNQMEHLNELVEEAYPVALTN